MGIGFWVEGLGRRIVRRTCTHAAPCCALPVWCHALLLHTQLESDTMSCHVRRALQTLQIRHRYITYVESDTMSFPPQGCGQSGEEREERGEVRGVPLAAPLASQKALLPLPPRVRI